MKKITGIKAISFDGDQTLWDFQKVTRHSLSCVLKELGKIDGDAAAILTVEKMIEVREKVASELRGRVIDLAEVRLEAFRKTLEGIGRPDERLARHLNEIYFAHRFENAHLFDDTIPALSILKKKFNLGLFSNGNTYPENAGLGGIFDFVVFSQDHGIEKPDPRIFKIALEKAGCAKHELLHVGDSLKNDVEGACMAGIRCVWLNRDGMENTCGFSIDYEISSLSELAEMM